MLANIFASVTDPNSPFASSPIDKLNFKYSALIFGFLCSFCTFRSYIGEPIYCWTPEYFTEQWVNYVNSYCWIKNTYYIPDNMYIQEARDVLHIQEDIKYYQWVPLILLFMSVSFFIPNLLWHGIMRHTIDIHTIVENFPGNYVTNDSLSLTDREEEMSRIAFNLKHLLESRKPVHSNAKICKLYLSLVRSGYFFFSFGYDYGNYICPWYFIIKVLYILLNAFHIYFLSLFFGSYFYLFGFHAMSNFVKDFQWDSLSVKQFPKITICDFVIRQLGQPKTHSVQCLLTVNIFNEKIFTFVWFWIAMALISTTFSLFTWIWNIVLRCNRYRYIKHLLIISMLPEQRVAELDGKDFEKTLDAFVDEFFMPDGVFVIQMIQHNSSMPITACLLRALWDLFKKEHKKRKEQCQTPQQEYEINGKTKQDEYYTTPFTELIPPDYNSITTCETSKYYKSTDA